MRGGHPLEIGRAEIGGSTLRRHWEHVVAAEKDSNDLKGKPYNGKSLRTLLRQGNWDIITIQQASIQSGDAATYEPYARKLYDYVKKMQPLARVVMHQTWAYRTDSKDFSRITVKDSARSAQQMWRKSRAAYRATAKDLGIGLIPVGDAFWTINSSKVWAYHKDKKFDFTRPNPDRLPDRRYSLHVGYQWVGDNFMFDSHHANTAGCYLGAAVWYGYLFNESPVSLMYVPNAIDSAFGAELRKTAWKAVKKGFFINGYSNQRYRSRESVQ